MSHTAKNQSVGQALVVTGDQSLANRVSRLLLSDGYETIECEDYPDLVARATDAAPALIVVDAASSADGPLDMCRAIRQLPGCDFIPLLLLSESQDEAEAEQAYEQNVTTVVGKPIDEAAFRKTVQALGDTGRTLSGIRALRMPEADVLRTMPDAFFIAGKDGLLRQYLGGANDDKVLGPEEIEGR